MVVYQLVIGIPVQKLVGQISVFVFWQVVQAFKEVCLLHHQYFSKVLNLFYSTQSKVSSNHFMKTFLTAQHQLSLSKSNSSKVFFRSLKEVRVLLTPILKTRSSY